LGLEYDFARPDPHCPLNDWQTIMHVLTDPLLPLTNNAAERQLRHG
jgi:hypothetical protein